MLALIGFLLVVWSALTTGGIVTLALTWLACVGALLSAAAAAICRLGRTAS